MRKSDLVTLEWALVEARYRRAFAQLDEEEARAGGPGSWAQQARVAQRRNVERLAKRRAAR